MRPLTKLYGVTVMMKSLHRHLLPLRHKTFSPVASCLGRDSRFISSSTTSSPAFLQVSEEVQEALNSKKAVVALESTIITHGMPYPHNFSTALCVERRVRENGAVPATVAVINGKLCVGVSDTDIIWLAEKNSSLTKISRRDLASVISQGDSGGTTVSATMIAAHMAGIPIFATGGIGGVHRGAETSFDVSADLTELGRTPVAVVSSGVKSILDIPKTLEYLETQGVLVASFSETRQFPAFFTQDSGHCAPYNVATHLDAARIIESQLGLGLQTGMLFAVPIPTELSPAGQVIEDAIAEALVQASKQNITGREVTPFVLGMVNQLTEGESLVANIALVENNASVAGGIANCLAQLRAGVAPADITPPPHVSSFSILQPTPSPALASAISSATGRGVDNSHGADSARDQSSSDEDTSDPNTDTKKAHGRPVVLGATVIDLTVKVGHEGFKMNGATHAGKMSQSFGGVGRNLADCLSRLGSNPVFVSAVGKDTNLEGCSHMDTSLVQRLDDQWTARYCVILRHDGHILFGVGDMDINTAFDADAVEQLDEVIRQAPVVMMDGNFPPDAIRNVVSKCALYNVPVWFEPTDLHKSRKPFETDAWKNLSIISPNLMELANMHKALMAAQGSSAGESLSFTELAELEEVIGVCVRLCQDLTQHIPVVVVTLGHHGLLLCHRLALRGQHLLQALGSGTLASFQAVYYPPLTQSVEIASVSGAGDCLAAALLAAMLEGRPTDECAYLSLTAAQLSLESQIAVPATITQSAVLGKQPSDMSSVWKPRVIEAARINC